MIELTNLYLIRNCGCDDMTTGLALMTDEQLTFFKNIIENLNKNSTYGCMPTIEVFKINMDLLKDVTDEDDDDTVMYLDDRKYNLKDPWTIWSDEFEAGRVI